MSADSGVWYATRERLASTIDKGMPPEDLLRLDEKIEAASRAAEDLLHRRFYPEIRTQHFDWPDRTAGRSWRLWLDQYEMIERPTSVISGGTSLDVDDLLMYPSDDPPFNCIETNLGSQGSFLSANTHQESVAVTGLFGYSDRSQSAGTTASSVDADDAILDVSDPRPQLGIGSVIKVGSERMIVTDRTWLTTGQTLQTPVSASAGATTLVVSDGTEYTPGEMLLLDAEKIKVDFVAGNSLIVRRAQQGTVLASHSGSTIYGLRRLVVVRGALGTTATSHGSGIAFTSWLPPRLLSSLVVAEARNDFVSENADYARTIGSGENVREVRGNSLRDLRKQAIVSLGRRARTWAV